MAEAGPDAVPPSEALSYEQARDKLAAVVKRLEAGGPTLEQSLELWERGARLYPLDQGLLALRVALPEVKSETLAGWPLGKRNRALLEWHSFCFSSRLQAWAG